MNAGDDILFERRGGLGLVILNRPKALNAISLAMVRALRGQLDAWAGLDPHMAKAELEDDARLFYRNTDFNTYGVLNVREAFADAHPELVHRVLAVYERGRQFALEHPEGPAESVFVTEFACRGKGACPAYCCCVERDPGSFAWAGDTDAARFRSDAATWGDLNRRATSASASDGVREDADLAAHRLNLAVGQCPTMAIHWVTPRQRTVLEEEVVNAVNGRSTPDEAGARVYELLAKAKWENGRAAAPAANKRRAKASTRWVDWY